MFGIRIDTKEIRVGLQRLADDLQAAASQSLDEAADAAAKDVKATTLFKDGPNRPGRGTHLRDSAEASRGSSNASTFRSFVRVRAKHASFVNDGTPPHVISARKKPTLRFRFNGGWVSKKSVDHPGTKPRPFMDHAEFVGQVVLENELEERTNRAIARFNRR